MGSAWTATAKISAIRRQTEAVIAAIAANATSTISRLNATDRPIRVSQRVEDRKGRSIMSKMSGDTARYNRIRKHRTKMREKVRELRAEIVARKAASASPADKPAA
jgi:hypothetical protein